MEFAISSRYFVGKGPNSDLIDQNITDIISITQTADGGMNQIIHICQRVKEILASDGDLDESQTQEYNTLAGKVSEILRSTSFKEKNLLDGSFGFYTVKIGEGAKDTMTFSMPDLRKAPRSLEKIDIQKSQRQEAIVIVDGLLAQVKSERSKLSVLLDRLSNTLRNLRFAEPVESKPDRNSIFLDA